MVMALPIRTNVFNFLLSKKVKISLTSTSRQNANKHRHMTISTYCKIPFMNLVTVLCYYI